MATIATITKDRIIQQNVTIKDGGVQAVVSPAQFTISVDIVLPVMAAVCGGCNSCNFLNDACDTATSVCSQDCKKGLEGYFCDRFCEYGQFGIECTKTCHCNNHACDPRTGTCPPGGWKRGYTGISCCTKCSRGYYGYNCNKSYDGCLSDACDREFCICINISGCNPGWQPGHEKYDLACVSETFGDQCTQTCHCINKPYDPIAGTCPPGGCQRGYVGRTCSRKCSTNSYGVSCEYPCDTCVNRICDRFDGNCTYGCIEGFKEDRCHITECATGTHGVIWESRCDTCVGNICETRDRNCTYGCIEDFKGACCNLSGAHYEDTVITEEDQPYDLIGQ